jgi:hypothetical protein
MSQIKPDLEAITISRLGRPIIRTTMEAAAIEDLGSRPKIQTPTCQKLTPQ